MKQLIVVAALGLIGVTACGSDEPGQTPAETTPGAATMVAATTVAATTVAATTYPIAAQPTTTTGAPAVFYANCAEAKAAGAAPLHRGDPGYRSDLDRDGDGVACET